MNVTTTCNRCGGLVHGVAGAPIQCPNCGNQGTAPVVYQQQPQVIVYQQAPTLSRRDVGVAYLLWFFLGAWGAHKFYLGQSGMGVAYLFTLGFCGIGLLIDLFTLPGQVRQANGE